MCWKTINSQIESGPPRDSHLRHSYSLNKNKQLFKEFIEELNIQTQSLKSKRTKTDNGPLFQSLIYGLVIARQISTQQKLSNPIQR